MQNEEPKPECLATGENEPGPENASLPSEIAQSDLSPFCDGVCQICASGFADKVNEMRGKKTLRELSQYFSDEYGVEWSKDSFARHFRKYLEKVNKKSLSIAYQAFRAETETVAKHQTQVLFLASHTFQEIIRRIDNGTLEVGVDQFEKLLKLYYQILRDPDAAAVPDVTEVYIRAMKRYNVPLEHQSMPLYTPALKTQEGQAA